MSSAPSYSRRDQQLEWSLLFNFLVHGLALVGMALLLMPMLPGGGGLDDAARIATIAEHPWRFRLGWLPWQGCAVADLWMAIAMVRTPWLPRIPALAVLALTLVAVVPDQYAQAIWVTRGVELAQTDATKYLALEREIFPLTSGWGALFYTLAALGWTWCFAKSGAWSRALGVLSVPLWSSMAVAVSAVILPPSLRPSATFVALANAVGFLQLQLWLGLLCEAVLRRARPVERHGRLAPWRHPSAGLLGRVAESVANSRVFGALLEPLPELEVRSDITDVVYVNYVVPAEAAQRLVPPGLTLQRLGPDGRYALFTFLTYRHGHFGFALLGPLRRLMPSPIQTNWRVHVVDPRTGMRGIYFLTNAIAHSVMALGARMTTEGMPMHVLADATLERAEDGALSVRLDPGRGSAPDAELSLRPLKSPPVLSGRFAECWHTFQDFLAYCVPQDRAMSSQPLRNRVSRQEIHLGIPLEACTPLEGSVRSKRAAEIAGEEAPLCFHVPNVSFRFAEEAHDVYSRRE